MAGAGWGQNHKSPGSGHKRVTATKILIFICRLNYPLSDWLSKVTGVQRANGGREKSML